MRIAVVGDLLLDRDLSGQATRLSPDAPVPVVDVQDDSYRAGGAGLVARMLAGDGHQVVLVSVLGDDAAAHRLRGALAGLELACGPSGAPTPVKSRVRANGQGVVRFDEGCALPPVPQATSTMLGAIAGADAVVVADYGRRVVENPRIRAALQAKAETHPVVWDPHPAGARPVPGCSAITPNHSEALKFAGALGTEPAQEPSAAAAALHTEWGCPVVVTLGEHGALLQHQDGQPVRLPAPQVGAHDPCGAGDRFASALAVALAEGQELPEAVATAVDAAAGFLGSGGVAELGELPAATAQPMDVGTVAGEPDPWRVIEQVRGAEGTVVATGGCFDLLHAGHTRTLQQARAMGDCLIVLLNSDESVRRLKGSTRPIIAGDDRAELLLALDCVDAVVIFDEDTPHAVLEQIRPDIWVKGGDYDAQTLPETPLIESWGGRSVTVPYRVARSTTSLAAALARVG